jgi:Phage integrase family
LRHSHATHMLASGVHPKIAQERLGHSSVGITLDLYSHVLPGMQAEAVLGLTMRCRALYRNWPRNRNGSKRVAKADLYRGVRTTEPRRRKDLGV